MLRPFGIRIGENDPILSASEEIRGQVDLLHKEGGVVKDERDMLGGLLDLADLTVSEVMVHRTKMRTINADLSSEEIVREVLSSPYTRLPLWRGSQENIVGVLHAKDLLRALDAVGGDASKLRVEAIALETWFVPDTTSLRDQLKAFLAKKTHFALVVDEYGEVMGLVTLEDILEEIVGDIKDEHDVSVQGVRPQPDGSVNVDGSVPIRDLNRAMDWDLPDEEATTIAGLVIHEARAIPDAGQAFTFHGFRFQVLRKSRNRRPPSRPRAPRARGGGGGGGARGGALRGAVRSARGGGGKVGAWVRGGGGGALVGEGGGRRRAGGGGGGPGQTDRVRLARPGGGAGVGQAVEGQDLADPDGAARREVPRAIRRRAGPGRGTAVWPVTAIRFGIRRMVRRWPPAPGACGRGAASSRPGTSSGRPGRRGRCSAPPSTRR